MIKWLVLGGAVLGGVYLYRRSVMGAPVASASFASTGRAASSGLAGALPAPQLVVPNRAAAPSLATVATGVASSALRAPATAIQNQLATLSQRLKTYSIGITSSAA